MHNKTIGLECTLEEDGTEMFLRFLAAKYHSFSVPWCSINGDNSEQFRSTESKSPAWVEQLAENALLELVLFAYGKNALHSIIWDYDDFEKSECSACLLYYDCGVLEIYVKSNDEFAAIWNELTLLHAQNMVAKTVRNDGRSKLYL